MNRKKTIRRRRLSAIVAVVTAMALLVGGTFAWQSIRQRAVNNSGGTPEEPGGRLHDDFMELQNFLTPENGNKDVYVENFSGPTEVEPDAVGRPMFVRVRFTEYMEIGEGAGLYKVDPVGADPIDYQDLDKVGTGGEGRIEDTNNHAESVIDTVPATPTPSVSPAPAGPTEPSILDLDTWHTHIPDPEVSDDGSDLHYYWDWTMGGSKIYMPTFNMDNESLLTDRTEYEHEQFTAGEVIADTEYYKDGETSSAPVTHTAQSTLVTEDVITMEEWLNLGRPIENTDTGHAYWVADEDGWFYWSRALQPGNATGLLLDGITMVREPDAQWYYGIHVISEMASAGDWGDSATGTGFYEEGISNNALFLLNQAADLQPQVRSISIEEGRRVYVNAGSEINLNANLSVDNTSGDVGESMVTWSIDPATADSQLDRTDADSAIFRTTDEDEGNIFTITATSPKLEGSEVKSDSIQVIVIPSDAVGVVGPQANTSYYVNYGDNTFQSIDSDGNLGDLRSGGTDKIVGNNNDKLQVVENTTGTKLIDNGDGSYSIKGPDGFLGTADDLLRWPRDPADPSIEDADLIAYDIRDAEYEFIITQVPGSGNGANKVFAGAGNIQYTATVKVTNAPDPDQLADNQNIIWSLDGTYKANTKVDPATPTTTVTLTADAAETGPITLKATLEENPTATGAVETQDITVVTTGRVNGEKFIDETGVEWQVIATDGDGNHLIMKTTQVGIAQYKTTDVWSKYNDSNLMPSLTSFYDSLGNDIKSKALPVTIDDTRTGVDNPIGWSGSEKLERDLSKAGTGSPTAANAVFILSISEYNTYRGNIAFSASNWWLRTPGGTSPYGAVSSVSSGGGDVSYGNASNTLGYRPALWITSGI